MRWVTGMDLSAVVAEVASKLEGVRRRGDGSPLYLEGRLRGCEVEVRCEHTSTSQGSTGWSVTASAQGAPLLLRARRTGVRGRAALATGDPAFDGAWRVEAAPLPVAREVLDAGVREAMSRLGPGASTPAAFFVLGGAVVAAPVEVAGGKVTARGAGAFEASEVLAGVEVVVRVHERLRAVAGARESAPPSPEEDAAMAALRHAWKPPWARSPWVRGLGIAGLVVAVVAECAIELRDCMH